MKKVLLALAAATTLLGGCLSWKSPLLDRPQNAETDRAVNDLWRAEISAKAQTGDWILSRSYFFIGDVIATGTGSVFSHAALYDAERDTVIEAVATGVREIPLTEFLQRNHYVAIVRPANMTVADKAVAMARARSQLGKPFDNRGMIGLDNSSAFYCSELNFWAGQTDRRLGASERVVTPQDLMKYGTLIYWSGARTNVQTMSNAVARHHRTNPTVQITQLPSP